MPASPPLKDAHVLKRTAFIDNSVPGVFKPVPWHLVEYAFHNSNGEYKTRELWEMVDIDNGSRGRITNKVVNEVRFINPNDLYHKRALPENAYDKNRNGVNGGPRESSRTI